ncbi:hypothetical protein J3U21_11570 [Gilliamella sp. B2776]|uniref:hypothetical protein n=1 Tax=unclassified Gilliamella TaxID=2685620 RepID=UPI002269FFDF|nr:MULTISPECIES: hypothetical protein [unclassified Gilliamella]MCX8650976.1 hypothetical protein [Gilliamella sp. B2779]MCX8653801.1 hypothetical protein [Gilliamella sp. B2737]MCX8692786.1 hypothetical protein [Gilliamella sp. B2776]MCX8703942.1 hypothetical protein [Gilliamella sp. B2781]WDM18475.1 hypothetical protein J4T76_10250 [Gilliamella sp. B3022]
MKTINKLTLCILSLFFSNLVFGQDSLIAARNVPENTLLDNLLGNPLVFILFFVFVWFFGKHFSK